MGNFISVKPDLHIVVTIAQHACDRVLRRVLKLSTYRLQIFLVKYESCDHYNYVKTKAYLESLENLFANMCLRSLRRDMWKPGFKFESCADNVKQGRFQRLYSNGRKTDISASKRVTFQSE